MQKVQAGTYETLDGKYRMIKVYHDGSFSGPFTWQLAQQTARGWEGFDAAATKRELYPWLKIARENDKRQQAIRTNAGKIG